MAVAAEDSFQLAFTGSNAEVVRRDRDRLHRYPWSLPVSGESMSDTTDSLDAIVDDRVVISYLEALAIPVQETP